MQPWLRFLRSPAGWGPLPQPDTPLSQSTLVTPLSVRDMLIASSPLLRSSRAEPCVRRAWEWSRRGRPLRGAITAPRPARARTRHTHTEQGRACGARFWITADVRREAHQLSVFFKVSLKLYVYRETRAARARTHRHTYARARLRARALCTNHQAGTKAPGRGVAHAHLDLAL